MPELPHIDEHAIAVDAPAGRTWAALGRMLAGLDGRAAVALGKALGVRPGGSSGDPLVEGSTLLGFRVARDEPRAELVLEGAHRFSRYALIFRLDEQSPSRTIVRAESRAEFPGAAGRLYRALVIGTRGHVLAVNRMLRATKRRAER